ncbi:MAG TPA: TIGR02186 family protein [Stellaceae bacterium]|nr:TIGR02186 family protein [Stellaceae bacterium]
MSAARAARRLGLAAGFCLALLPRPALPATVVADLSSHLIAITTGFTGASVVLFGATDGPADVVAVVRGPERDTTIWRKGKFLGIWGNAESMTFANIPSFYAVAASRPLDDILSPSAAALYRIGVDNLKLAARTGAEPEKARRFTDGLIAVQQHAGLFATSVGKIAFLGERLFRTTLVFPANVPTGPYLVEVFLVRERDVVGGQTTPLTVSKAGVDAEVFEFAHRRSVGYGAIAVVMAVMAGWIASLPFRNT